MCPKPFLSKAGKALVPVVITSITICANTCILVLEAGSPLLLFVTCATSD